MTKHIFPALVLLFLAFRSDAQSKNEKDILRVLELQSNCWNTGNIPCFMHFYHRSDSLKFVGKSGITYGWENTMNNYLKSYPDTSFMGKLQFTILHMDKLSSNRYMVSGKWFLKRTKGDVGGYFTLLFRKIKGKWYIVYDHTS
jgi:hypothetical protein